MRILHICYSDSRGGAAIAAYNIFKSQKDLGLDVYFLCYEKFHDDKKIIEIEKNFLKKKIHQYQKGLDRRLIKFFIKDRDNSHSTGLFGLGIIDKIKKINPDIINLHWINNSMLSIKEISNLKKFKIFWTLHDMWPFCATGHYTIRDDYIIGYEKIKKLDFEKFIFKKKKKYFGNFINIICPSRWIFEQVKKSDLFKENEIKIIHHPMDEKLWNLDYKLNTNFLSFSEKYNNIILFGSERGSNLKRKNFNFLLETVSKIKKKIKKTVYSYLVEKKEKIYILKISM
ncbi:hypothetical protein HIMB5_00004080 [alpha proteobacterium HIMB5]|nr:hypothetical protein HIMB5_00004080 [alpha proteobacterium HIMB5]